MTKFKLLALSGAGLLGVGVSAGSAVAAVGDTTTWVFDTPAIANNAQHPPYARVADLTLTEEAGGVRFMLDPNESNTGYQVNSFIDHVFFVYNTGTGPALTGGEINQTLAPPQSVGSFTWSAGNPIDSFSLPNGHTEAGYSPLIVDVQFPNKNSDGELRFRSNETSEWFISGTHLTDFTTSLASADNKPSPVFGVLSIAGFSGDSSNWVAQVPESSTWAMLLAGLVGVGGIVRRQLRA